jgi:hypothetical protein
VGVACSTYEREEKCIQVLMVKPKGKRLLVRIRRRWDDDIKRMMGTWPGLIWLRIGTDGRLL